jgi:hypothetical protein
MDTIVRTSARDIVPGDVVTSPADRYHAAYTGTVVRSERSSWAGAIDGANPWWRLTFADDYWIESAASHRFDVIA